ncbi:nitrogen regulatory protein A [Enterococcus sp. PF1-24]|uniref:GAF domain-containing protein n=1 Tax=unclassified Enterococcus TaxID=2608891 RepID=UPI002476683B|nr:MULTISPECIES: GAF domain-containing protein [unclassified Enterococcus]MDH6363230.1 nitrogen regulatory protein A [Enterococcus sp. PFB1-1]MDH6400469.1 nitrogen regulatory protein A [Enterococcus sp. PF1-24]
MSEVKQWLDEKRVAWQSDFVGIAVNTAPSNQAKEIRWNYVSGNLNQHYQSIRLRVGRGIAGIVWQTAREHQDNHIFSQPDLLLEYPIARLEKLEAVIGIPIMQDNLVMGILLLGSRIPKVFSNEEIANVKKELSIVEALLAGELNE